MSGLEDVRALVCQANEIAPILALDLGTSTGWAIRRGDGLVLSGSASFKPGRYEGGGMRFLRFAQWLDSLDVPQAVYFEEVRRHAGTDAAHAYGGFLATLTAWCERRSIPYAGIPVGTIKRHATGKGNAGKPEMMAAMRAKGFTPADDNEADALAILLFAMEQHRNAPARTAPLPLHYQAREI
jgi:Holliday junction resolvasome RuvABC endonuclease subunit